MCVPALVGGAHEVPSGGGRGGWLAESEEQSIAWRKSTASNSGSCVEVAIHDGSVLVRDSMNPVRAVLKLSPTAWSAFLAFTRSDPAIRVVRASSS
jgi:hypothetical protein